MSNVVVGLLVFAWFAVIRLLTHEGWLYAKVVRPLAEASFGVYLVHILLLVPIGAALKPHLPTPLAIPAIAGATFVLSSLAVLALRRLLAALRLPQLV